MASSVWLSLGLNYKYKVLVVYSLRQVSMEPTLQTTVSTKASVS